MKDCSRIFTVAVYCLSVTALISMLHSWHYLDLTPEAQAKPLLKPFDSDKKVMLHVLGEGCGCSEFTAEYLIKRGPHKPITEIIYYVSNNENLERKKDKDLFKELKRAGFLVSEKNLKSLNTMDLDILGVPFMQVYSESGTLSYSGGYSEKMITRTTNFEDLKILASIAENKPIGVKPVFGCITGKSYQRATDPLGIKY